MKSEIRKVRWYEWSKFKKSMIRNMSHDPQISQTNFFIRFLMFIWFRIKAENYFYIKDNEIAGILSLSTNRGDQLFIYTIAVESTFRKQGIGKALMTFSGERASELKKCFLALVVMANNSPAISLYEKHGYRRVGEGITYLSIMADKIQTNETNSLELRKHNYNDSSLMGILRQFVLGEIEAVSGKAGLEYFERISYPEYYASIKKVIQKEKQLIYSIYSDEILVGFLLLSDRKQQRDVAVCSHVDTWNFDFLNNLSSSLMGIPSSSGEINILRFKLSISKVEKMEFSNQTVFERDFSRNKMLMFRKL
ncbi:MAG: GNAT family N-acetyltransferase [Candidatus Heimdallarchaeota archaeon]|nr:GNAT family N-acetyltransferase [Candidatus Heimdallarchaeota archaeon]MBY8993726.1 GNAT family N-acetyltransferase [Candidatus Heimdallarchaeota archaeon]